MSLEQQVSELTTAINALTAAIKAGGVPAAAPAAKPADPVKPAAKPAAEKKDAPAAAKAPITYDQLKTAFVNLVGVKGRDRALEVIAPLTTLKPFEADQSDQKTMAELIAKITEAAK